MNAVLAIIAGGGQAIVVIYTEGEEINYFLLNFIDFDKTLQRQPHPTPCKEAHGGGVCSSIKTMALEGGMAPLWCGCMCACV
jgi:ligand-binding sensor protein